MEIPSEMTYVFQHFSPYFAILQEIYQVYDALSKVPNGFFTIAAAFGNVHGVYQPGNVKLEPTILDKDPRLAIEIVDLPWFSHKKWWIFP